MSFPRFKELPLELQDHVWECYIPAHPSPIAHAVNFAPSLESIENVSSLQRFRVLTQPKREYPGFDRYEALQTLRRTTSRSRAVSLRHPDVFAPPKSMVLREGPPDRPMPELHINSSRDLVVLVKGWGPRLKRLPQGHVRELLSHEPVRYLALPFYYDIEYEDLDLLRRLLRGFEQVEVVYLLLDPGCLPRDSASYITREDLPEGFWYGTTEFIELPVEVTQWGGPELAAFTRLQRLVSSDGDSYGMLGNNSEGPKSIRLMTWRQPKEDTHE